MSSFHLPYVGCAIGASDQQKVIQRPPFDGLNRENVSGGQEDASLFFQGQKRHRVITSHATNALLNSRTTRGWRNLKK